MSRTKKDAPAWLRRMNAAQKTGLYRHNHYLFGRTVMATRKKKDADGNFITVKEVFTYDDFILDPFDVSKWVRVPVTEVVETPVWESYPRRVYADRCTAHEELKIAGSRWSYVTEDGYDAPCEPDWYHESQGVVLSPWRQRPSPEDKRMYHKGARSSEKTQMVKMRQMARAVDTLDDLGGYDTDEFEIVKNSRSQRHVGWWD